MGTQDSQTSYLVDIEAQELLQQFQDCFGGTNLTMPRIKENLIHSRIKDELYAEEVVNTKYGDVMVAIKGDRANPTILTYHDLGLNYISNFKSFFNFPISDITEIVQNFRIVHVNAPGQEEGARVLPEDFEYPDMDQLADQVNDVINHFGIERFVGIGVGLGANVLIRYVLKYPQRVYSLMIINAGCNASGWIEWGYQKRNISQLRLHGMTESVMFYLLLFHFGRRTSFSSDRSNIYQIKSKSKYEIKEYIEKLHASNLAKLTEKYNQRTAIDLDTCGTINVPVLNVVGSYSHFVYEAAILNNTLNPKKTEWLKFENCGMVVFEKTQKLAEAFRIFLQGPGLCHQIITMQQEKLTPRLFSFLFNLDKSLPEKSTNEICSPEHQELIKEDIIEEEQIIKLQTEELKPDPQKLSRGDFVAKEFNIKKINVEELYDQYFYEGDLNEEELYEEDLSDEEPYEEDFSEEELN